MRLKSYRLFYILAILTILLMNTVPTFALSWDGSSSGGDGGGSPAGPDGYAIRTTDDNCIGYRFSVVDKQGNTKNGVVLDVFRNTSAGNKEYTSAYKFAVKYNKKQLVNNQNNSYNTIKTTTGCIKETSMDFASSLPIPDNMHSWQSNNNNLNKILYNLGITGGVSALVNGDKVLVEPLYDVRLQGYYHGLTTTELAIYGKWLLGANSNGGSSGTSESWGFISDYTNKHYPNSLFTPDGQGLWSSASTLSSRATFYSIINKGYGVGIAYTETKPDFSPALSVSLCEAWRGSKSNRSFNYGKSNGSSFGNFTCINDYPVKGDSIWFSLNFPSESQTIRVRQYARVKGGNWTSREVNLSSSVASSIRYEVDFSPNTVDGSRSYYIIEAKQDWIDSNGNVLKSGAVKSFYIPVKPKINRYQVTLYDITGKQAARNGSEGLRGSVYAGQRVYPQYTYTSENSWTSSNYFRAALYAWKNNSWSTAYPNNGGSDLYADNQSINQYSPFSRYSNLGLYTVPDNSTNTNGSNRIPFKLWTYWASDISNTSETTWIDIPIIKADVELKEIRLIDENYNYISGDKLWVGQKVTPQYVYKNNSGCTIYVEGYEIGGSRINGIYEIPAYGEIYVNGDQIVVPDQTTYSLWGGVYLDGAGIYNTQNETNRNNNTKTRSYGVEHPLKIEPLMPNSTYRENTQVITSFKVYNNSYVSYIPRNNVSAKLSVYIGSNLIYSTTKISIVIPAKGDNLVYFKWTVPGNLNYVDLNIKGEIIDNGSVADYKSFANKTAPQINSQTPDTVFEEKRPDGWSRPATPITYGNYATWSEWIYENNTFVKKTYGINLSSTSADITPDSNSHSSNYVNGVWKTKSGYGFSLKYVPVKASFSGTEYPSSSSYTEVQGAYAIFPDFNYSTIIGKFRSLDKVSGAFCFKPNTSANYKRIHYIPLWYPDGKENYSISCYAYDFWTPAGMITEQVKSNSFSIIESAYDDWVIGR